MTNVNFNHVKNQKKYFFDHIPKTAGTTINRILGQVFNKSDTGTSISGDLGTLLAKFSAKHLVSGHVRIQPGDSLDKSRYSFTVLRNPIDRIVSLFFFWKNNPNAQRYANTDEIQSMTFRDFVLSNDYRFIKEIENYQTNHFMFLECSGDKQMSNDEKLIAAQKGIDRYDLVGVQDMLDDFVFVLCWENGWSPTISLPKANKTISRPSVAELEPDIYMHLYQLNRLDIELVEYARKQFNMRKNQVFRTILSSYSSIPESFSESIPTENLKSSVLQGTDSKTSLDMGTKDIEFCSVRVYGNVNNSPPFFAGETICIETVFFSQIDTDDLTHGISIRNEAREIVYGVNSRLLGFRIAVVKNCQYQASFTFRNDLGMGRYSVDVSLHKGEHHIGQCFHWKEDAALFDIYGNVGYEFVGHLKLYPDFGCICCDKAKSKAGGSIVVEDYAFCQSIQKYGFLNEPLPEFTASIEPLSQLQRVKAGELMGLMIKITNRSSVKWPSAGKQAVKVGYHWLDEDGNLLVFDGVRTVLPRDIMPHEVVNINLIIMAPEIPGDNLSLQIALVQEDISWFEEYGVIIQNINCSA